MWTVFCIRQCTCTSASVWAHCAPEPPAADWSANVIAWTLWCPRPKPIRANPALPRCAGPIRQPLDRGAGLRAGVPLGRPARCSQGPCHYECVPMRFYIHTPLLCMAARAGGQEAYLERQLSPAGRCLLTRAWLGYISHNATDCGGGGLFIATSYLRNYWSDF